MPLLSMLIFFFFNDTATTEIYTLSLHDALPILVPPSRMATATSRIRPPTWARTPVVSTSTTAKDRKSTRLNSSHDQISYAVFCLKKKNSNNARGRRERDLDVSGLHDRGNRAQSI